MSDSDRPPKRNLPAHTSDRDLEELEPHERRIERVASAYYSACGRVARAIRRVKGLFGDDEE